MNSYLKHILIQALVWTFSLAYFTLLRQYGQELVDVPESRSFLEYSLIYVSIGLLCSIVLVSFDKWISKKLNTVNSFGISILIKSIVYLIVSVLLLIAAIAFYTITSEEITILAAIQNYLISKEGLLTLSYFFLISLLIHFVEHVNKKFGPGNLVRMLKGEFYRPKEVNRIVMFLDLKSSTAIAEKIGHIKYSRLIQDCFNQLGMVANFGAEIYQYVGDEVVLIWEPEKGLNSSNILKFFYAYTETLTQKTLHYISEYGVVPKFKCGCHIGNVVMTEIGQIKREIAFHGDVMNTAARIQSQCNAFNKEFLVSEALFNLLSHDPAFEFELIEDVVLKGKSSTIKIYCVGKNDMN
ncbi:MAG: adenylate/guanylate cyclase domain-containing protein [Bacteroidota bacterium]